MVASALLLATACGDDDKGSNQNPDGGSTTNPDGSINNNIDASTPDAATSGDGSTTPGDANIAPVAQLAIIGVWNNKNRGGGDTVITATKLGDDAVVKFDNTGRFVITQTNPDAMNGNKFNRVAWAELTKDGFRLCNQDSAKDTAAAAEATTMMADTSNTDDSGCGAENAPWEQYILPIDIRGDWQNAGMAFHVDSDYFGDTYIKSYDDAEDSALLITAVDSTSGAETYKRVVWSATATRVDYCILAATYMSQDTAEAGTEKPAVGATTCNGGAWTSLTK